nr:MULTISPECIES: PilZ domain-containing protein [Myxococcaceae]
MTPLSSEPLSPRRTRAAVNQDPGEKPRSTSSSSLRGADKRRTPRVSVNLTAHCRIGTRFIRDPVADLSLGGLYLRTHEPAREGTPVRAALALPSQDGPRYLTLVGSVARVDTDPRGHAQGLGVAFAEEQMAEQDRAHLGAFIAERLAAVA